IGENVGSTAQLALASMAVAVAIGVPLGLMAALARNSWFDVGSMIVALLGVSMPSFWLGLLMIVAFSLHLGWFPATGGGDLWHLVLPSVTLGMIASAIIARLTRSSMLEVLGQDYVRTARAKAPDATAGRRRRPGDLDRARVDGGGGALAQPPRSDQDGAARSAPGAGGAFSPRERSVRPRRREPRTPRRPAFADGRSHRGLDRDRPRHAGRPALGLLRGPRRRVRDARHRRPACLPRYPARPGDRQRAEPGLEQRYARGRPLGGAELRPARPSEHALGPGAALRRSRARARRARSLDRRPLHPAQRRRAPHRDRHARP